MGGNPIVNTMVVDDMATQGARVSAAVVWLSLEYRYMYVNTLYCTGVILHHKARQSLD